MTVVYWTAANFAKKRECPVSKMMIPEVDENTIRDAYNLLLLGPNAKHLRQPVSSDYVD